jgi:hypothetical protein
MESIFEAYSIAHNASHREAFLPNRNHEADRWPIIILNERCQISRPILWHASGSRDHCPLGAFYQTDIPFRARCLQGYDSTVLRVGATRLADCFCSCLVLFHDLGYASSELDNEISTCDVLLRLHWLYLYWTRCCVGWSMAVAGARVGKWQDESLGEGAHLNKILRSHLRQERVQYFEDSKFFKTYGKRSSLQIGNVMGHQHLRSTKFLIFGMVNTRDYCRSLL